MAFTSRQDGYFSIYIGDPSTHLWYRAIDIATVEDAPERAWLDFIGQPSWSPDGTHLAYTCIDENGVPQICTAASDGSDVRQLTEETFPSHYPDWSPDGRRIAFMRPGGRKEHDIWLMNADGTDQTPVMDTLANEGAPRWSPDGRRILFNVAGGDYDLFTVARNGTNLANLTNSKDIEAIGAWSPDGKKIAYAISDGRGKEPITEIWTMDADGSNKEIVTSEGHPSWPTWSPEGDRLAFMTEEDEERSGILSTSLRGTDKRWIYDGPDLEMHPDWFWGP